MSVKWKLYVFLMLNKHNMHIRRIRLATSYSGTLNCSFQPLAIYILHCNHKQQKLSTCFLEPQQIAL